MYQLEVEVELQLHPQETTHAQGAFIAQSHLEWLSRAHTEASPQGAQRNFMICSVCSPGSMVAWIATTLLPPYFWRNYAGTDCQGLRDRRKPHVPSEYIKTTDHRCQGCIFVLRNFVS